jgi:hypothetical protein
MVRLAKFPQFKEYFAKQETHQIYRTVKNNSRYRQVSYFLQAMKTLMDSRGIDLLCF